MKYPDDNLNSTLLSINVLKSAMKRPLGGSYQQFPQRLIISSPLLSLIDNLSLKLSASFPISLKDSEWPHPPTQAYSNVRSALRTVFNKEMLISYKHKIFTNLEA